ncbi:DUF1922 domain-containing protein [Brachyspira innocens]
MYFLCSIARYLYNYNDNISRLCPCGKR